MIRPLILIVAAAILTTVAVVLVATVAAVISLARDEDAHAEDCTGPCCDPGADDLEAVARVTGLVDWPAVPDVEALALAALIDRCIDRLVEGETCPDYPEQIKWGAL